MTHLIATLFLLILSYLAVSAQPAPNVSIITAKTEAPVLLYNDGAAVSFATPEDEYAKLMKLFLTRSNYIQMKKKPANLSADARFGRGLVVSGNNVSWILDGNDASGYTLYADWNADGDLSNDPVTKLEKIDDKYSHVFSKTLTETFENQPQTYFYDLKIEVAMLPPPGETEKKLALKLYYGTSREGVLSVGDRKVKFSLYGSSGTYNTQYNSLYFDLNGDGIFDTAARYSAERYKIPEKYVNIDDTTYEYSVDRYGTELKLTPLAEKLPGRVNLSVGSIAPEITFTDIAGKSHKLSDFRGKVVLLDFWGTWCGPCVAEAPNLAANYKRLKEKGFEILSFDEGDTLEDLQKFTTEKGMNWTHIRMDAPLKELYRVDRFPTYFLLNKDGKIISNTLHAGDEMYKKVEEMVKVDR